MGNRVCVKNYKLREQHIQCVWGATGHFYFHITMCKGGGGKGERCRDYMWRGQ